MAFGALALVGCSETPSASHYAEKANPPLYEITNKDGVVEGWMLGTIHALPDGIAWRTETIDRIIQKADYLVVEIADLDDRAGLNQTFRQLATSPDQPELYTRVPQTSHPALTRLLARSDFSLDDFASTETWAVALTFAQLAATGDIANGIDKAVIREFNGREIRELEGALMQLGIFDNLPEQDQRDLFEGVLAEAELAQDDPNRISKAWIAGDEVVLEEATRSGIMADPELRQALLVARNERWTQYLVKMLEASDQPLIAVGAAHLVGPDSVNRMLELHGYTVKRLAK